ncbi:MAG: DHH family phosphoesterase [Oscillospiraceae bacterium]|nr:DHH family phosphoesterase [Oscillospiraceae bacterium]
MRKILSKLLDANLRPCFFCLLLFVLATVLIEPVLAAVEAMIVLVLFLYYRKQGRQQRRSMTQYLETIAGGTDAVHGSSTMLNTPLPVVVFRADNGEIIWANDGFLALYTGEEDVFSMTIGDIAPKFNYQEIISGENCVGELTKIDGHSYQVYGSASRVKGHADLVTAYFVDVTEREHLREIYEASRLVVSILVLDNYEELLKAGGDASKSAAMAQIDALLNEWVMYTGGLLRKFDRDRYLFICDEHCFSQLAESRFSILETIHQVVSEDGVTATLSIGTGRECETYEESFQWASKSIEMALSRGGDQAVVKDSLDFQFYGGRAQSTQKRTKVKSRVMAKALGELIADASEVYVMGHTNADMDALGAAAGICCVARKHGKKYRVVLDVENNSAMALMRKLGMVPEYEDVFISGSDAFIHARPGALLVVVDTNRPDMVESRQLLDSCNRVAVIDHHRRASTYIESAALNFHEPYASSASELVTELLQYMVEPSDILRVELEGLLSGIMLDTKNFMMRTGGRTCEAAAFLRRTGADPVEVRRFFQSDLESFNQRNDIIRNARIYHGDIAIATAREVVSRVTAAKAADELITLKGIQGSIVLYKAGDGVGLSGRSLGEINMQFILERLGGGGNATTAGGYVPNCDVDAVYIRVTDAIDAYYKE